MADPEFREQLRELPPSAKLVAKVLEDVRQRWNDVVSEHHSGQIVPDLRPIDESCPECGSGDVGAVAFGEWFCYRCRHEWPAE